jgi:hypothetical protein
MFGNCGCDADCPPNLHCNLDATMPCTVGPDGVSQQCHSAGECAAAWQRACTTSADCGPGGFSCVVNGSVCTNGNCQPITTCQPPSLPGSCVTDADCPAAWTCEPDTIVMTACVPELINCPASGCPAPTGAKSCQPPMFDLVGGSNVLGHPAPAGSMCLAGGGGAGGAPNQSSGAADQSSGCQLAPAGRMDAGALLVLLGLLGLNVRRRRA